MSFALFHCSCECYCYGDCYQEDFRERDGDICGDCECHNESEEMSVDEAEGLKEMDWQNW